MPSNYRPFPSLGKPYKGNDFCKASDNNIHDKLCGIYYLTDGLDVLYVGKSTDVYGRVRKWLSSDIDFSQVFVDQCEPEALNKLEHEAIQRYQPPLNVIGQPQG